MVCSENGGAPPQDENGWQLMKARWAAKKEASAEFRSWEGGPADVRLVFHPKLVHGMK